MAKAAAKPDRELRKTKVSSYNLEKLSAASVHVPKVAKKPAPKKAAKTGKKTSGPTYFSLIKKAIKEAGTQHGAALPTIVKHIQSNRPEKSDRRRILLTIKKAVAEKRLMKTVGTQKYRLGASEKKKKATRKVTPKKSVAQKAGVKKAGVKKSGVKKAGAKKAGVKKAVTKKAGTTQKTGVKKASTKKSTSGKAVAKKAGAKKTLPKKPTTKKSVTKKTTKKTATSKPTKASTKKTATKPAAKATVTKGTKRRSTTEKETVPAKKQKVINTETAEASSSSEASGTEGTAPQGKWQYFDNGWHNYEEHASAIVEGMYQEFLTYPEPREVVVKSGRFTYSVDFVANKQTNTETKKQRDIRRY